MSERIGKVASECLPADTHARAARTWLIIVGVAAIVAHLPTFLNLALAYTGADSYYAHWFLIPPVSAFFIWLKKDTLRRLPLQGSPVGLVLLAGSLVVHVFAVWFRIDFVSAFSFAVTMWGLALYLFGQRVVREISFALFFLLFMVPLPQLVIGPLAFHIKILSGKLAVWLYTVFGGTAILRGSSIVFSNGKPVWMGYECSGLRSLVTLAALGAAFAHLVESSRPRKVVLFLMSFPFSVLSNAARVTLLCFAANRWGAGSKSFKIFHDVSSPFVFILVLVGLFGVYKLLSSGRPAKREAQSEAAPSDIPRPAKPFSAGIPRRRLHVVFGLFVISAVLVFLAPHPLFIIDWMSALKPVKLPQRIGAWQKTSSELVGDERAWSMLNTRSVVFDGYRNPEGKEVQVMVVASDTHRNAFHPPEVCMLGVGNEVVKKWEEPIAVDSRGAKGLYLNAFLLRGSGSPETLVLYWFMVGERSMGSRFLQHLIFLLNGARRTPVIGSMIRVTAPLVGISEEEGLHAAKDLIRSLVPLMPRLLKGAEGERGQKGG